MGVKLGLLLCKDNVVVFMEFEGLDIDIKGIGFVVV